MVSEAAKLALIVGICTWAFRYLPLRARLQDVAPDGPLGRFLAATGPAAIATLFVAEAMPYFGHVEGRLVPLVAGVAAVVAVFRWRQSAVLSTLAGSVAYGLASWSGLVG